VCVCGVAFVLFVFCYFCLCTRVFCFLNMYWFQPILTGPEGKCVCVCVWCCFCSVRVLLFLSVHTSVLFVVHVLVPAHSHWAGRKIFNTKSTVLSNRTVLWKREKCIEQKRIFTRTFPAGSGMKRSVKQKSIPTHHCGGPKEDSQK
jgi:hypothetical protein